MEGISNARQPGGRKAENGLNGVGGGGSGIWRTKREGYNGGSGCVAIRMHLASRS